jgi:putative oxidoreductase
MDLRTLIDPDRPVARSLRALQHPLALASRLYVSWVFLKSGWLKITTWDSTLSLFESEYRVPIVSPLIAAVAGTAGELIFALLLIAGLFGRLSALGLFAVNLLAVISYSHVLLQDGFEAAIGQHYLWGYILAVLTVYGPGAFSADTLLARRAG